MADDTDPGAGARRELERISRISGRIREAAGLDKLQEVTDSLERLQTANKVVVRGVQFDARGGLRADGEVLRAAAEIQRASDGPQLAVNKAREDREQAMVDLLGALVTEAHASARREWWIIGIGFGGIITAIVIAALT